MSATLQTPPQTTAPHGTVPAVAPHPRHRYFDTDHLTADLRGRTLRGGAVTLSAQAVKFVLRLGSTAVLARLLTPADFGLIAMVTVVTGFVEMFKDAGLSMATVQRDKITHAQVSTLFWINVALSLLVMLAIAALAPAVAWFYGEPRLLPVTLALAATMVFGGLAVQHQALLKRNMRFGRLAAIEILSMAAGIAAAILMASAGFTYWALVAMTAVTAATTAALSLALTGWVPGLPVRGSGVRSMLGFGGNLVGSNVALHAMRNLDSIVVGAFLGATPLGLYSRAYNLLVASMAQIATPVFSVAVPAFSRLQDDPVRYRHAFLRSIGAVTTITIPLLVLCFLQAPAIVTLILGPQWAEAAPVFRWLTPVALASALGGAPGWLFVSLGRTRQQLIVNLASVPVILAGALAGLQWGITGVAISVAASYFFTLCASMGVALYGSPVRIRDCVRAVCRPVLCSTLAAWASSSFPLDAGLSTLPNAALQASTFLAVYCVAFTLSAGARGAARSFPRWLLTREA